MPTFSFVSANERRHEPDALSGTVKSAGLAAGTKRQVFVIALLYYEDYLKDTRKFIRSLTRSVPVDRICFVINNEALDEKRIRDFFAKTNSRIETVRHDNCGGEFGGYQRGLDHFRNAIGSDTTLVVLNDTILRHEPVSSWEQGKFFSLVKKPDTAGFIVGRVDHTARMLSIGSYRSSRWVRSNLMAFDLEALRALQWTFFDSKLQEYVKESAHFDEFFTLDVGRPAQEHIARWLTSESGPRWYNAEALSEKNMQSLARKTRAILQEKGISMKLDHAGCAFLDIRLQSLGTRILNRLRSGRVLEWRRLSA